MVLATEPVEKNCTYPHACAGRKNFSATKLYSRYEAAPGAQLFAVGELCAVWRSSLWRGCGPFVSVADVLGIVVSATWCGTGCLVEPNCHGGARYRPPAHPSDSRAGASHVPDAPATRGWRAATAGGWWPARRDLRVTGANVRHVHGAAPMRSR